jgi:hypothetical protein
MIIKFNYQLENKIIYYRLNFIFIYLILFYIIYNINTENDKVKFINFIKNII